VRKRAVVRQPGVLPRGCESATGQPPWSRRVWPL